MARNKSDIFCLKEAEYGDEQGTLLFSVNGKCSVRSNRKHPRSKPIEDLSEESKDEEESTKLNIDYTASEANEEIEKNTVHELVTNETKQEELSNMGSTNSKMARNPLTGEGIETAEKLTVQQKRRFGNQSEKWFW